MINRMLKSAASFLRIREWADSKAPLLAGVFAYFIFLNDEPFDGHFAKFCAYLAFVSAFLALSYVVNDLSDLEADRIAGKQKIVADMPKSAVLAAMLAILITGNAPLIILAESKLMCIVAILFVYLFGFAYSVPGIRFKERGALGLVECSVAQRCMPMVVVPPLEKSVPWAFVLLFLLSFFNGLRYILIHQLQDKDNDAKTGISTYAVAKPALYVRNLIRLCLLAEILGCCIAIAPIAIAHPVLATICLAVQILVEYSAYFVLVRCADKDWVATFDSVPLDFFYNAVFPVMTIIAIAPFSLYSAIALMLIAVLNTSNARVKLGFVKISVELKATR